MLDAAGITLEEWNELSEVEREDTAIDHAHELFSVGPKYAPSLNAVDDYYALVKGIQNENIRETAMTFIPNVENYTIIFSNIIAATMRQKVITADHVMMATEIIYDNLHNLTIWLEQKQDFKEGKKRDMAIQSWKKAYNKCKKMVDKRANREVVSKTELQKTYAALEGVAERTAERRLNKMVDGGVFTRYQTGRSRLLLLTIEVM